MAAKALPPQAFLRECFDYDPLTGVLTWRHRPVSHFRTQRDQILWNAKNVGAVANCKTPCGSYFRVGLLKKRWMVHRIIWMMQTGTDVPEVDHRDSNGLNNRWDNLREATRATNVLNQIGWQSRTLPKGVSAQRGKWLAQIQYQKKFYYLGRFDTIEEAHAAYREAAHRLHGEFANEGRKR